LARPSETFLKFGQTSRLCIWRNPFKLVFGLKILVFGLKIAQCACHTAAEDASNSHRVTCDLGQLCGKFLGSLLELVELTQPESFFHTSSLVHSHFEFEKPEIPSTWGD